MSAPALVLRPATRRDVPTLVEFNRAMALETEGRALDPERLRAGVEGLFEDPTRGAYRLALEGERALGGLMVTYEWSDWRAGRFWWLQSVYVRPEARRRGVFGRLYRDLLEAARADPEVCGLRLYVERENHAAQAVYRRLGMQDAGYRFFEVDFVLEAPGR